MRLYVSVPIAANLVELTCHILFNNDDVIMSHYS